MQIGETIVLSALSAPAGVTLLDDPEDRPRDALPAAAADRGAEEIEAETELVGEGGEEQAQDAEGAGSEGASGGE